MLESGDLEVMLLVRDSLLNEGARELAREGGGRRSGDGLSASEVTVGATMVASDI